MRFCNIYFFKKLITTYWELKEIVILRHHLINCNPSPIFAALDIYVLQQCTKH